MLTVNRYGITLCRLRPGESFTPPDASLLTCTSVAAIRRIAPGGSWRADLLCRGRVRIQVAVILHGAGGSTGGADEAATCAGKNPATGNITAAGNRAAAGDGAATRDGGGGGDLSTRHLLAETVTGGEGDDLTGDPREVSLQLDLAPFESGRLEFTFQALTDAEILVPCMAAEPLVGLPGGTGIGSGEEAAASLPAEGSVLYSFILPDPGSAGTGADLYCRLQAGSGGRSAAEKGQIRLGPGVRADFLTYFNAFSAMKWRRHTNVRDLRVYVDIRGLAEICLAGQYGEETFLVSRHLIQAPERGIFVLPVPEAWHFALIGVVIRDLSGDPSRVCLLPPSPSPFPEQAGSAAAPFQTLALSPSPAAVISSSSATDPPPSSPVGSSSSPVAGPFSSFPDAVSPAGVANVSPADMVAVPAGACTVIWGGGWLTRDPPLREVRLGLVITTFRREAAVKAAVSRLTRDLDVQPHLRDRISLAVVDNGRTLKPGDLPGAELIPSPNLGGTGGFTRGMLHFRDRGDCTHCLFMDDDASCEPGAIYRSMSFADHALDPAAAISGAMLYEGIRHLQWENGAWFDGGCHSLHRDLDLRSPAALYANEQETDLRIYGAWWYFLFPLDHALNLPFPFFVRGDDIDFSYANGFRILTLNGVSSWQQDFRSKDSALVAYLVIRSHLVHHLTVTFLSSSYGALFRILKRSFLRHNNSYYYGSAACVCLALEHVLRGPEFWQENMVPEGILGEIARISAREKMVPWDPQDHKPAALQECRGYARGFWGRILRRLTFNGHLLPPVLLRGTPGDMIPRRKAPSQALAFGRRQITVLNEDARTVLVLRRNSGDYFRNLLRFLILSLHLALSLPSLRRRYRESLPVFRSREFWEAQFRKGSGAD